MGSADCGATHLLQRPVVVLHVEEVGPPKTVAAAGGCGVPERTAPGVQQQRRVHQHRGRERRRHPATAASQRRSSTPRKEGDGVT